MNSTLSRAIFRGCLALLVASFGGQASAQSGPPGSAHELKIEFNETANDKVSESDFAKIQVYRDSVSYFKNDIHLVPPGYEHYPYWIPFKFALDDRKVLGQACLARIGASNKFVLFLNYNIPPLQPQPVPTGYGFARFSIKLLKGDPYPQITARIAKTDRLAKDAPKPDTKAFLDWIKKDQSMEPISITGIFPTGQVLSINKELTNRLDAKISPTYMGAQPGSLEYERTDKDTYPYAKPTVVGAFSRFGDASWTYYPAKAQQPLFGEQTAVCLLTIPGEETTSSTDKKVLRIQTTLDYQVTQLKVIPYPVQRKKEFVEIPIDQTILGLDDFLKYYSANMPQGILTAVSNLQDKSIDPVKVSPNSTTDYFTKDKILYAIFANGTVVPLTQQPAPTPATGHNSASIPALR